MTGGHEPEQAEDDEDGKAPGVPDVPVDVHEEPHERQDDESARATDAADPARRPADGLRDVGRHQFEDGRVGESHPGPEHEHAEDGRPEPRRDGHRRAAEGHRGETDDGDSLAPEPIAHPSGGHANERAVDDEDARQQPRRREPEFVELLPVGRKPGREGGEPAAEYCCSAQADGTGITDGGQPNYAPRTTFRQRDAAGESLIFDLRDKAVKGLAGVLAGLLGIAVGELTNTMLTVRKRLPVQLAVGTAAFVLHLTILAALLANLVVLRLQPPGLDVGGFSIPLGVGAILAPTVVVGGQVGSLINSKLSEETAIRVMIVAYTLVGLFVLGRILFLGGRATH